MTESLDVERLAIALHKSSWSTGTDEPRPRLARELAAEIAQAYEVTPRQRHWAADLLGVEPIDNGDGTDTVTLLLGEARVTQPTTDPKTCPICKGQYPRTYEEHTGSARHRAAISKAVGR